MSKSFEDYAMRAYEKADLKSPSSGAILLSMARYADYWARWSAVPNGWVHEPKRLGVAARRDPWMDGERRNQSGGC